MKINTLKLGIIVQEKSTGLEGMLTLFEYRRDGRIWYCVQPRGLNPETKQPMKAFWAEEVSIENGQFVLMELPVDVLGTQVTDEATGFTGTAIYLTQHISGCVHIGIQPKGISEKGEVIESLNFDIRRCSGAAIPKMTEDERAKDQQEKPSPVGGAYSSSLPKY